MKRKHIKYLEKQDKINQQQLNPEQNQGLSDDPSQKARDGDQLVNSQEEKLQKLND